MQDAMKGRMMRLTGTYVEVQPLDSGHTPTPPIGTWHKQLITHEPHSPVLVTYHNPNMTHFAFTLTF